MEQVGHYLYCWIHVPGADGLDDVHAECGMGRSGARTRHGTGEFGMTTIIDLKAREILDSRGIPTIEVDVRLDGGAWGRAAAPSGGSRGTREALELRDGDSDRYNGCGVRRAVENVRDVIAPAIVGMDCEGPRTLDHRLIELDGTPERSRLGANAMLAVSMAVTYALAGGNHLYEFLAMQRKVRLPVPMFNVLNGGAHAGNNVDIQEFMIAPVGAASFSEALRMGVEVYSALRALLKRAGLATSVGDEGGFAPELNVAHTQPLDLLLAAIERAGLKAEKDIVIAVDVAAGELSDGNTYVFRKSMRRRRSTEQMIQFYASWLKHYPIWSIEDGLAEADIEGWRALTQTIGDRVQLVGDDLFVTNASLLRSGIAAGLANAILIKLNQVGTVSETLQAIAEAERGHYGVVVSHRAGETDCDFIADLAVATRAGQIKAGAPVRGERVAKYNQLLRIEEVLGAGAVYAGREFSARGSFLVRNVEQEVQRSELPRPLPEHGMGGPPAHPLS
jgi:enolase